jgi:hypothetical protein
MQAKINGDRIVCGKCGALLAKLTGTSKCNGIETFSDSELEWKKKSIEIKCKHKSQGKYCDTINEILL